ncbi:probable 28S rRNA (cytosine(4447)-C(5))-methyltransferase [Penaeus monodon]|uniref:probable 28S rRNA (cytosine(4447)-C(5))-methyltransferase n=1 Tax=Penaeus monodon TaxID=6687 RepID=UPI0018A76DEE|nr:probable 28S rRNA (cytosine(4447)-C(5))-methyltransferase [Penaeus monodon]
MGRAANYHLKPKKGPGRKAKKQQAPVFQFKDEDGEEKKLSRRQKLRAKKRKLKNKEPEIVAPKKARNWAPESEEEDAGSDGQQLDSPEVSDEELEEQTSGKPKSTLFDDDDDDDVNGFDEMDDDDVDSYDDFDEDDDYDDDIEKLSRKLEKKKKAEDAEGDAYMEEAAGKIEIQIPTIEEVEKELSENPDLANVQSRIKDIAFILSDFSNRREEGRSRSEYLSIFLKDLTTYYSYNEFLMEKILHMFGVTELVEFLEANERPRPVTIRTNTLKTRRKLLASALIDQGVDVDVIAWSKVGLIVMQTPGSVALGATPQYLAGQYLLQGASSFLPVMALAPKNGEKVLDMCAAPGGKSTHIAAIMKNTGMIVSNDVHAARVKALVGNFHRMGITNSLITNMDGRMFAKKMPGAFDRILLDAPCSGTGVISKDESVKITKDAKDIQRCSHLQRELLLAAIDSVHKYNGENGYVVYSTCSILVEENEEVIDYALRKRKVKLVPTGLEIGKPGYIHYRGHKFDPNMHLCKRVYPHSYNMDGFFVAKLKKLDDGPRITAQEETTEETAEEMGGGD